MTYLHQKHLLDDLVIQPSQLKGDRGYMYMFPIGGIIYLFVISQHIIPQIPVEWKDTVINPEGEMKIIHLSSNLAEKTLKTLLGIKTK